MKNIPLKNKTSKTLGDNRSVSAGMSKENLWGDSRFEQPEFKKPSNIDGIAKRGKTRAK